MSVPSGLDEPCSEHFTYRELIECGETWARLNGVDAMGERVDNVPRVEETFAAMRELCVAVLEPLTLQLGRPELTYCFASRLLTRHVKGRIHPPLDQHAGHERNSRGDPICARLGLAVDLSVPGRDSFDVAHWIIKNTKFDRLYFYGPDRSLHVSVGPENSRQMVHMRRGKSGRRVPQIVTQAFFAAATGYAGSCQPKG